MARYNVTREQSPLSPSIILTIPRRNSRPRKARTVRDEHTANSPDGASNTPPDLEPPTSPAASEPVQRPPRGSFDAQFRAHNKDVFREAAARDTLAGRDPIAQARDYAARGKPDFVLAYLLVGDLPDDEKRALLAGAYERRAQLTEQKADEFDHRFHRPFPLLRLEASKDRTLAQRIRSGGSLRPGLGRPLPTL